MLLSWGSAGVLAEPDRVLGESLEFGRGWLLAASAVHSIRADSAGSCCVALVKLDKKLQCSPTALLAAVFSVFVITNPKFTHKIIQLLVYLFPWAP